MVCCPYIVRALLCFKVLIVSLLIFLPLSLLPNLSHAENIINTRVLNINVAPKSYPPFFIREKEQESGVFLEIIQEIVKHQGKELKLMRIPRKRGNAWVAKGQNNAVVRAIEWVPDAANFLFSDPILQFKSVLVSLKSNPLEFDYLDQLRGKKLLTRLGFKYPQLQPYFDMKTITRIDADAQYKMFRLLKKGRADAAIMNEQVALWLIKKHQLKGQFNLSKSSFGVFDIRVMFNKANSEYINSFNQSLYNIKRQGAIERILKHYQ